MQQCTEQREVKRAPAVPVLTVLVTAAHLRTIHTLTRGRFAVELHRYQTTDACLARSQCSVICPERVPHACLARSGTLLSVIRPQKAYNACLTPIIPPLNHLPSPEKKTHVQRSRTIGFVSGFVAHFTSSRT